jgi:hypothetical protein
VNAHLKGRIFQLKGINYLVMQEDGTSVDYVLVRALNSRRRVERMSVSKVMQSLADNAIGVIPQATD